MNEIDLDYCYNLTYLDVSNCDSLQDLDIKECYDLEYLDLSNNSNLERLTAYGCFDLSVLDLSNGNNTIIQEINMNYGLNDLYCITVDDPNYSENNWINDNGFYIDNHIGFSEDCSDFDVCDGLYVTSSAGSLASIYDINDSYDYYSNWFTDTLFIGVCGGNNSVDIEFEIEHANNWFGNDVPNHQIILPNGQIGEEFNFSNNNLPEGHYDINVVFDDTICSYPLHINVHELDEFFTTNIQPASCYGIDDAVLSIETLNQDEDGEWEDYFIINEFQVNIMNVGFDLDMIDQENYVNPYANYIVSNNENITLDIYFP